MMMWIYRRIDNDSSWRGSKTVFGQTDATGGQLGCEVGGVGSVDLTHLNRCGNVLTHLMHHEALVIIMKYDE